MNAVIVISTEIVKKIRQIKIRRFGKSDIQDVVEASPFGIDSNPPKDLVAVYLASDDKGNSAIVGYINKNQKAGIGETRFYSVDANGAVKGFIWIKKDGNITINGDGDNAVRWTPLSSKLSTEANNITIELMKISAALNSIIPGLYVPTAITIDISQAKITDIKTTP